MKREVLKIQGMYCVNCTQRIERAVLSLNGVSACKADFARGEAEIVYDSGKTSRSDICECLRNLGYEPDGEDSKGLQTASILVILLSLYLIANHLGLLSIFNAFPVIETGMSYGAVFVVGLLTSVHCIAMCGGINLTQSVLSAERQGNTLRANAHYQAGRVLSYTLIGGIVGAVGGVVSFSGRMRGLVLILAGLLMLGMTLRMLGVFRFLRGFPVSLPQFRSGGEQSNFVVGLLNGFMPCGPLQAMQLYALSRGTFAGGALSMLLFGLGTVPLMFGFGALSGRLNQTYRRQMLTVSALLIFVLSLGMFGNGLALTGVSWSALSQDRTNRAILEDARQFVRSEVDYGNYESITVSSGIPVEWTIHVPEGRLNGCNREIIVQEYGLDIRLHEGDNLVQFTPNESGTVAFSCWMGMIAGSIHVMPSG